MYSDGVSDEVVVNINEAIWDGCISDDSKTLNHHKTLDVSKTI